MPRFVPNGQGKGWAKGRTAATDARIARNAAAHRGLTYERHLPPEQDRRYPSRSTRTLPLEWSNDMAYVVGLIATDGCLITGRKQLNFKSEDEQLVQTFLRCLGRVPRYSAVRTRSGNTVYVIQFSDARFYDWLMTVGLMPRKSLILGAISVPDEFAMPLVRGLLDGDGNLTNMVHRPTPSTYPNYEYERLWVFFNSASRAHVDWLRELLARLLGLRGYLEVRAARPPHHEFFRLKLGRHESMKLLRAIYPTADVPKLERKWRVWQAYRVRHDLHEERGAWNPVPTAGLEPAWAYAHRLLKTAPQPIGLRRRRCQF